MMCARLSKESLIRRILVVSLSNIGDVVLSCPVIDILHRDFPQAQIDVVVGQKAASLFADSPFFGIKVYDKKAPLREKYAWFLELYHARYDLVVDLRQTLLGGLLRAKYATPVLFRNSFQGHMRDKHLNRLRQVYAYDVPESRQYAVLTKKEDELFFEKEVLPPLGGRNFVVIAPGAADAAKRWQPQGFAAVADQWAAAYKVVFVGDNQDAGLIDGIQKMMKTAAVSLAGKINLRQLAFILKKSSWVLCHDSGVMHLACYVDVPVVVLWGPTDVVKYAPWGKQSVIVRRNAQCMRCGNPKSDLPHNCMSFIEVEDVLNAIKQK
jgi:ADP-heptose:LPS heptosyltransferase